MDVSLQQTMINALKMSFRVCVCVCVGSSEQLRQCDSNCYSINSTPTTKRGHQHLCKQRAVPAHFCTTPIIDQLFNEPLFLEITKT